jgi:catechol 2,3-dioxygenase-like lactoylglutathione lyase family enzyme
VTAPPPPPGLGGLLETTLYCADPDASAAFYERVFGLAAMLRTPRLVAMDAGSRGVLLLFRKGATSEDLVDDEGVIPGHEGEGRLHMAFAIAAEDYEAWRDRLVDLGVPLAGETRWRRGGRSLYVRDPDGHAIELCTPGLWPNY